MGKDAAGKGRSKRVVRKSGSDRPGRPRRAAKPRAAKARAAKPRAGASDRQRRAVEAVLGAFAHDVRTPLTGILAFSELLATSGLNEREHRWTAAIKDAAEHLAALATLIIEGARAGARALPPRHEAFDLPRLASALAASLAARAEAKNLACDIDLAATLPPYVKGDPLGLRTALENLMANAVKFTEHGKIGLK